MEDIRGGVAVLRLAPGVRTQVQLHDLVGKRGERPDRRIKKGDQVEVVIKRVVIQEGRVEVEPVVPTEDLEKRFPVGSTVQGRVVGLKDYGAFVEIGDGVTGLVHRREMSWCRVVRPSDVVSKGDTVTVRILRIRPDGKVDLSMRAEEDDPERRYLPGTQVSAKVTRLLDDGVLVELEPGLEGLIHISELAWRYAEYPEEVVSEGEKLTVRVLGIHRELDIENRRRQLDLTLKRAFQARISIPRERIGRLIGRGGRTIKPIKAATDTQIQVNDDGIVRIWGASAENIGTAQAQIKALIPEAEIIPEV